MRTPKIIKEIEFKDLKPGMVFCLYRDVDYPYTVITPAHGGGVMVFDTYGMVGRATRACDCYLLDTSIYEGLEVLDAYKKKYNIQEVRFTCKNGKWSLEANCLGFWCAFNRFWRHHTLPRKTRTVTMKEVCDRFGENVVITKEEL